jgi:hypothetical protein
MAIDDLHWMKRMPGTSVGAARTHGVSGGAGVDAEDAQAAHHSWYDSSFDLRQGLDVIETNLDPLDTHGALLPSLAWLQLMSKRNRRR